MKKTQLNHTLGLLYERNTINEFVPKFTLRHGWIEVILKSPPAPLPQSQSATE